ncbi:MAG: hypothetical protein HY393_04210 [Candidatus Diapherotrites archaeon]|nr:hypothetical protein [Candidatus Diapherotrites archaeon]
MRAQLVLEIVVGVVVILLVFVGVLLVVGQQGESLRRTETSTLESQTCRGLAHAIESVYEGGPTSEVRVQLSLDANIQTGFILVGETFCTAHAQVSNASLSAGQVRVRNASSVVEVSNT